MIICIDFDGTCVSHEFPKVGKEIGATPILKELVAKGHQLILWTMRSNVTDPESVDPAIHTEKGDFLTEAINWFKERDIPLYAINQNPDQMTWTASPKAFAHYYIDDKSIGIPLTDQGYVDWSTLKWELKKLGLLNYTEEERKQLNQFESLVYSTASSFFLSESIPLELLNSDYTSQDLEDFVEDNKWQPLEYMSNVDVINLIDCASNDILNVLEEAKTVIYG